MDFGILESGEAAVVFDLKKSNAFIGVAVKESFFGDRPENARVFDGDFLPEGEGAFFDIDIADEDAFAFLFGVGSDIGNVFVRHRAFLL